jgi:hypothetical protein
MNKASTYVNPNDANQAALPKNKAKAIGGTNIMIKNKRIFKILRIKCLFIGICFVMIEIW